ncbi:ABC transporter [Cryptococcus deuterogattii 99/473]|uniref:ABC transporter n=1 Tax=Cryptococcus deuterogattii Ram5 TaxID=1296110 RepID=A0A0D0TW02_9TREE|nr:ABC transporter [Cryptococcus deuterogattii Ram5]KIY55687.1 ABC transporter [Cryptococcus deuterogattii 99/473]
MQSCPNHIVEDLELVSIHQHTELPLVPSSQLTNPLFLAEPEEQERLHRENEDWRKNTLLNLPPPLPYDLAVEKLTIGVPDRKALRLGGSGSGKTTLLNAIANRISGLPTINGEVAYYTAERYEGLKRGMKLEKGQVKKRIGFVRQQDFLVECLTVRETLTYAAKLRLPTHLSDEAITFIVEQTIDELGLRDAADTVVGGPLRKGISGGEKRRLSIGCVLVTLPSVLILDEPTSGLDAFTSYLLLLTLSQLARRGRTVILSIHAPRSDAFEIFDRIALLSKGEIVYSGLRKDCLAWFYSLGYEVERGVNPLDFLIDISSVDNRTPENEEASIARVLSLVQAWNTRSPTHWADNLEKASMHSSTSSLSISHLSSQEHNPAEVSSNGLIGDDTSRDTDARDEQRPGLWKQTRVLTARAHRNVYRNVPQLVGFAIQAVLLGVIIGITYYQLPETPTGIQSLKNLSFQLIPGVFYLQQVFWIYKFCTDLVIFDREREDRLYDVIPYVISDFISYLIPSILSPTIYVVLVYFISKLRTDNLAANLFISIASTILVQFTTQGLALLSHEFGVHIVGRAPPFHGWRFAQLNFFRTNVPVYVAWIRWISSYFYSFRIIATTQFKDRVFDCPAESNANLNQCLGNNVLNGLNFDYTINVGAWFGGLIGLAIIEYALACVVLWGLPVGGVKHASEIDSHHRGKETDVKESHMTRDKIDVSVRNLSLIWKRRGKRSFKDREKVILNNLSLDFPSGEVSAILGPSGAGKSTLLQLLAGRKLNPGPLSHFTTFGTLLFANQPTSRTTQSNVAFVEQDDDWHLPSLTVRETLTYAAILRLPDKMPKKQKIARAETVLRMLGLKDCADLPVGGALLKGISGGEKRRLSLAVQMINDPAVLVVDEPTSGLDASIALGVMHVLRDIAATGRTVIGKRSDAVQYFTSINHAMPSEFFNPADHLLDLVSIDPRVSYHKQSLTRVNGLTSQWRIKSAGHESGNEQETNGPGSAIIKCGEGTTPMRIALPVVLERHWKNLWRRKDVFFNRLVQTPLLGALFILFFQRLTHGPAGAQDRIGVTIESTSAIAFVGLLNAMSIFPADKNLYLHEAKSSARYSPATFVITYSLVELGFELLGGFGYGAIMNVAIGMQTSARIYFEYSISIWAMVNMGESFAMIFGSWIQTEGLTVTIVSTILSLIGQVSGVISLSVPAWLAAIAWGTCVKDLHCSIGMILIRRSLWEL